jgi:hypothetical protein
MIEPRSYRRETRASTARAAPSRIASWSIAARACRVRAVAPRSARSSWGGGGHTYASAASPSREPGGSRPVGWSARHDPERDLQNLPTAKVGCEPWHVLHLGRASHATVPRRRLDWQVLHARFSPGRRRRARGGLTFAGEVGSLSTIRLVALQPLQFLVEGVAFLSSLVARNP